MKNILTLLAGALVALALLSSMTRVTRGLASRLKPRLSARAAEAPMMKEAKELGITYEAAMADPVKVLGKHVLWCVYISSGEAYHSYDATDRLDIENIQEMPVSEHTYYRSVPCRTALLQIKGVKTSEFGQQRAVRLQLRYIDSP
jgi:hypothetical protein